jgi:VIT1/CCC1 family predicted Fe2+/Mn2+ transporter
MRALVHREIHSVSRIGWLRAAVLGANDGIVSTASLIVGVAASGANHSGILTAGVAALVAGALSMAAGEYVSVSSQSDTEKADLTRERLELETSPDNELEELAGIYRGRGLSDELARRVATELMAHDALAAHARDELGILEVTAARPVQAALTSALTFSLGAAAPILVAILAPVSTLTWTVSAAALLFLVILGGLGAWAGRAPLTRGILRVTGWGLLALAVTAGVGRLFGVAA